MVDPDLFLLAVFGWDDLFIAVMASAASSMAAHSASRRQKPPAAPIKQASPIKIGTLASTVPRAKTVRKKRRTFGGDDSPGGLLS